jgi:hypothetical protein
MPLNSLLPRGQGEAGEAGHKRRSKGAEDEYEQFKRNDVSHKRAQEILIEVGGPSGVLTFFAFRII